jgi:DNA-binding NtrC family response regulator
LATLAYFRAAPDWPQEASAAEHDRQEPPGTDEMARILVVDDDPLVLDSIAAALQLTAHEVLEACNGREALALLESVIADVIVTDIVMRELDGFGFILSLRKLYPGQRLLAISGGGSRSYMDFLAYAEKLGAHATLAKPFTPDQLIAAVERVLEMPAEPKTIA